MTRNRLSPSRSREDIRAWWAEHLAAQRKSGQTQVRLLPGAGTGSKVLYPLEGQTASDRGGECASHGPGGGRPQCGTAGIRDA